MSENIEIQCKLESVMNILTEFVISNKHGLYMELIKLNDELQIEYDKFEEKYKGLILGLIQESKNKGIIKPDIDNELIFYFIDMGISYFQNNLKYRQKIISDNIFKEQFMQFLLSKYFS